MAGESFKVIRAFLQSPKKVETVGVNVRVVIGIDIDRLLVRVLGKIARQVKAGRNVLVRSSSKVSRAQGPVTKGHAYAA